MFGLPNESGLSKVLVVLTQDHTNTQAGVTGIEDALLDQLQRAIGSSTSGADVSPGGGGGGMGAVVDTNAMDLWTEITGVISQHWPYRGNLVRSKESPASRLQLWAGTLGGTPGEGHLLEMCLYWERCIRDLLEPPRQTALRGVRCPTCKADTVTTVDEVGSRSYSPAILVHLSEAPVRAECLPCGDQWWGGQLLDLGTLDLQLS